MILEVCACRLLESSLEIIEWVFARGSAMKGEPLDRDGHVLCCFIFSVCCGRREDCEPLDGAGRDGEV